MTTIEFERQSFGLDNIKKATIFSSIIFGYNGYKSVIKFEVHKV